MGQSENERKKNERRYIVKRPVKTSFLTYLLRKTNKPLLYDGCFIAELIVNSVATSFEWQWRNGKWFGRYLPRRSHCFLPQTPTADEYAFTSMFFFSLFYCWLLCRSSIVFHRFTHSIGFVIVTAAK